MYMHTASGRYSASRSHPAPAGVGGILLRVVRSVERESGFAKRPNTMFNPAPFGRWTPNRFALGCRLT